MCSTFGNVTKDFKYISKSIKYLHESNQKSLINSLAKLMFQVGKKNDELYSPHHVLFINIILLFSRHFIFFLFQCTLLTEQFNLDVDVVLLHCLKL